MRRHVNFGSDASFDPRSIAAVNLGPGDEVEVFFKFRDFPGPWNFHCHNIEHEDHFMMARFTIRS